MTDADYQFVLLGQPEPFEPYLSGEIRKNGSLLLISEQDIPRSDSSLLAAFLTVRKPSVVFFAPGTKGAQVKYATSVYEAITHALQDTDSLLVSWHDTKTPFPLNENCHCLTFELPQLLISPDNRNFVTDWIEIFLNRKRVVVKEDDYVDLIDSRLLSLMSVKAALKALSNPDLCGSCRISANGTPLRSEVIEYIRALLSKILPDRHLAKVQFQQLQIPHPEEEPGNLAFQETFEVILPKWHSCVEETTAAYLAHHKLI